MKNKFLTITMIAFLIIIAIIFIIFAMNYFKNPTIIEGQEEIEECISWSEIKRLETEACYHPDSKNIILTIKRLEDNYDLKEFELLFNNQKFTSSSFPESSGYKIYKMSSETNPNKAELSISGEIRNKEICNRSRTIIIRNCSQTSDTNLSIALFLESITSKIKENEIEPHSQTPADILPEELFNPNQILDLKCKSSWTCTGWEECHNGVEKRDCKDKNNCLVSTNTPLFTRSCNGSCTENWECEWSKCSAGYSTPSCKDKNHCGTSHNKPEKISCYSEKRKNCIPNIICNDWDECNTNYNFINLLSPEITLTGMQYRRCHDQNNCLASFYESKQCSLKIDIYTKWGYYEEQNFIEVYNKLTNELLTRIAISKDQEKYFNIELL